MTKLLLLLMTKQTAAAEVGLRLLRDLSPGNKRIARSDDLLSLLSCAVETAD